MSTYTIDESQRKAAKIVGFTYLFTMAAVVFGQFGVHARLIVENNVAETARNILAHEGLFRISIACDLIYWTLAKIRPFSGGQLCSLSNFRQHPSIPDVNCIFSSGGACYLFDIEPSFARRLTA